MIQIKSQMMRKQLWKMVFGDLEWPREVKHIVDNDLSEPYRRNVNNRELNHVWISSHSLLCKRYGSSFLLKNIHFCIIV